MKYFSKKLQKSREESHIKNRALKAKFRASRNNFSRDHLKDQETAVQGVSDRGIEARRGNQGHIGYARVVSPEEHKQKARSYFRSIKNSQSTIKPNLPKSEDVDQNLSKATPVGFHSKDKLRIKTKSGWEKISGFDAHNPHKAAESAKKSGKHDLHHAHSIAADHHDKEQEGINQAREKEGRPEGYNKKAYAHHYKEAKESIKHAKVKAKDELWNRKASVASKDYMSSTSKKTPHRVAKERYDYHKMRATAKQHGSHIDRSAKKKWEEITKNDANFFTQAKQQGQMRELGTMATQGVKPKPKADWASKTRQDIQTTAQNRMETGIDNRSQKRVAAGKPAHNPQGRVLPDIFNDHKGVIPHDHPNRKEAVNYILGVWREHKGEGQMLSDKYLTGNRPKKPNIYAHMKSEILLAPSGKYMSGTQEVFGVELMKYEGQLIDYAILFKNIDGSIKELPSFLEGTKLIAKSILEDYKDKIS